MADYLISHRGEIGSGDEIFIHTMSATSPLSQSAVAALVASNWYDALTESGLGIQPYLADTVTYTDVTVAEILSLSTGALAAATTQALAAPVAGSGSPLPAQVALGVSFTAGTRPNGTPLRGRCYLPPLEASAVSVGGRIDAGIVTDVAECFATYFERLDALGVTVGVWSRTLAVVQPVTEVRVGNVWDTIRSRRNAIPETYVVGVSID